MGFAAEAVDLPDVNFPIVDVPIVDLPIVDLAIVDLPITGVCCWLSRGLGGLDGAGEEIGLGTAVAACFGEMSDGCCLDVTRERVIRSPMAITAAPPTPTISTTLRLKLPGVSVSPAVGTSGKSWL